MLCGGQDTVRWAMSQAASDGQAALSQPRGREHWPGASELPSWRPGDVAGSESLHREATCAWIESTRRAPAWQVVAEGDERDGGAYA
jgi:hypothetical protein